MRFYYFANIRLPTEKAHGLQIMQMCEAFADTNTGITLTLMVARRHNTAIMGQIDDVYQHYGVKNNFLLRYIPCLDILPRVKPGSIAEKWAFNLQTLTYNLLVMLFLLFDHADIYYSRDQITLLLLSLFKPRRSLVYEAHTLSKSGMGQRLQRWCVQRVGLVVAVTDRLRDDLSQYGARQSITAPDGIRLERFATMPTQNAARNTLNLPPEAFIVGYMGRLHTMSMSKGVDLLIEAIAALRDHAIYLGLVGGPAEMAGVLQDRWLACGLPPERFLFLGQVDPGQVPTCLAAFDVCAMPFPWTEHFAYYASPLKLFEYMAAGRAVLSSDLPAVAEVVENGLSALLVPPSDVRALAEAMRRLYDDPALRTRLAETAQQQAERYTWAHRAESILQAFHLDKKRA